MISGSTLANITDSILTPATAIWLVAAVIAATLLFGAINRRRQRLTESLKEFVDQNQMTAPAPVSNNQSADNRTDQPTPPDQDE